MDRLASGPTPNASLSCGSEGLEGLLVMASASVHPSGATLLLEREAQVAVLEALAGASRNGCGRFVVIEGRAGIGKARLLAERAPIAGSAGCGVHAALGSASDRSRALRHAHERSGSFHRRRPS